MAGLEEALMSHTLTTEQVGELIAWAEARKVVPRELVYSRLLRVLQTLRITQSALQEAVDTGIAILADRTALRERVAALEHMEAELQDFKDDHARTMAEVCDNPGGQDDRKHCPCVVHLQREIQALQLQVAIQGE